MPPPTPSPLPKWSVTGLMHQRGVRALLAVAAVLALLLALLWGVVRVWGAGWLAAPLQRSLGRAVTIDALEWRPGSLRVQVRGLQIAGMQPGQPLWRSERIELALSPSSLWQGRIVLAHVHIESPQLTLRRTGPGHYDVDDLLAKAMQAPAGPALSWSVHQLALQDGRIDFHDTPVGETHRIRALQLAWPFLSSAPADAAVVTQPHLSFELNGEPVTLQARSTPFAPDRATQALLQVPHLDLQRYRAYWPAAMPWQPVSGIARLRLDADFVQGPQARLRLRGELGLQDMRWRSAHGPAAEIGWNTLQLTLDGAEPLSSVWAWPRLRVEGLHAGLAGQTALAMGQFELQGLRLDHSQRVLQIDAVEIGQPDLRIDRDARGQWLWQRIAAAMPASPTAAEPSADTPWRWSLGRVRVQDGRFALHDEATPRPVSMQWTQCNLQLDGLDAGRTAEVPLQLSWRWEPGRLQPEQPAGRVAYRGQLRLGPGGQTVAVRGQLQAQQLPLHTVEPYAAPWLQARLLQGWLAYTGRLDLAWSPQGPAAELAGDLALRGMRLRMPAEPQDVLRWQTLELRGLAVQIDAGRLQRVSLAETALSDYAMQARLDSAGRLNLLDLVQRPVAADTGAAAASAPSVNVPVRLGPISLVQGQVSLRDDFVRPAYNVDLRDVTGAVSAFSNQPGAGGTPVPAEVLLRGRGEGGAELEIRGQVQPLARPPMLDLQGHLHGLDLAPLTGYSSRLTGYGIERGKLSLEARYRVDAQGQLQASNRIVLDQLVFGEHQDRAGAPDWPVKLAMSVLADRDGVVDIQLPIQGSLSDPQFSVGSIVFRLLFNLVAKAVTSPLALMAAAFGHGDEMTQVPFEPGQAALGSAALPALDKLASWMRQRERWVLTVQGEADAGREQAAYRRARLQQMVQAHKDRLTSATQATGVPVSGQEWPELLRQVYRAAPISKPRNLIGMVRDLPLQDMETLLLASIAVDEEAMQALAQARARNVRDALLARDIAAGQVFLATPKVGATSSDWTPRASLQLQSR